MATRRSHTKSRTGCRDCKRRKVKCDEAYPSCFNCSRHGILCSLSASQPSPANFTPQRSNITPSVNGLSPEAPYHFLDAAVDHGRLRSPAPSINHWGHGLELMHHYTLVTANTLSIRPDMQNVWRVTIPEIGYDCPFVMHGILTIAALHKAYLIPSARDKYLDLATSHQNAGIEGFRAQLPTVDDTDWKPLFCFASLVVSYVASLPVRTQHHLESEPDILGVFILVRGVRTILEPYQRRLVNTEFAPMATGIWTADPDDPSFTHPPLHRSPLPPDVFEALQGLYDFFQENLDDTAGDEYGTAVKELEKAVYFMAHAGANPETGMIFFWPYVISENIMADIRAKNPYSMVLLAYFGVFLCVLEPRFWFLRGWSRCLFAMVDVQLAGHPVLLEAVKWPRKQVFEFYAQV
ncbi:hypothetical protein CORC01_08707 [Colletotrichum orchidophilum]|uniref:Zn(2)-C6 fungal-type domain-containing protein n=1 Tax=Colletotrichum orchidophilum TaxID=1209926 RepID=A0A1G4B3P3_9PEZI|nr:uncharacterized protein CORC01_08707 [Colletotrichum orchidophilum]OHE96014.1 hypothetical protein CORC01_08707 [Colletotrichum orchidophilum]